MTTENQFQQNQIEQLRQAHPEWSFYEPTMRIKRVFFEEPVSPAEVIQETLQAWKTSRNLFQAPLVQIRAILPSRSRQNLLDGLVDCWAGEASRAQVVGEIPFLARGERYAIYYLQVESENRKSFTNGNGMLHEEAVSLGFEKRGRHQSRNIDGFTFRAIDFQGGTPIDILTGERMDFNLNNLAQEIVAVHKAAFEYPHDPAQQTVEGVREILSSNPIVLAFDQKGAISSIGFMEKDSRFTFGQGVLVEPTYCTLPQAEGRGLSSRLRSMVRTLVREGHKVPSYHNRPIILFNESIRHSSFPLCLENGFELAGDPNSAINGNLGDAYTAIGPASPEVGYMPMGLTYLTSPELKID